MVKASASTDTADVKTAMETMTVVAESVNMVKVVVVGTVKASADVNADVAGLNSHRNTASVKPIYPYLKTP